MPIDPEKWNPGLRDVPPEVYTALREHWVACPACDHVIEWHSATPGALSCRGNPEHMEIRQWNPRRAGVRPGLAVVVRDAKGGLLYLCWYPRTEAIRLRDILQSWFRDPSPP